MIGFFFLTQNVSKTLNSIFSCFREVNKQVAPYSGVVNNALQKLQFG
jgi:hypothetical protein